MHLFQHAKAVLSRPDTSESAKKVCLVQRFPAVCWLLLLAVPLPSYTVHAFQFFQTAYRGGYYSRQSCPLGRKLHGLGMVASFHVDTAAVGSI
jgi:hypothetical protein